MFLLWRFILEGRRVRGNKGRKSGSWKEILEMVKEILSLYEVKIGEGVKIKNFYVDFL